MPGPNHQRKMSSRPLSQRSYGGIDWVASSWMSDVSASDVVALEGVDVALQQLAVGRVERTAPRRSALDVSRLERRARPLERAVDRGDARVEQLGDLGAPATAAPRTGSAPRAAGAADAGAPRRTRAGSTRARRPRRPGRPPAHEPVRDRLDPRGLRQRVQVGRHRLAAPGRDPSAGRGAPGPRACRSTRSSQSGRARSGAPSGLRTGRRRATRGRASPGRRPRPRTASRASGSSTR